MNHKPSLFEKILIKLFDRFDIFKKVNGKEELYLRRIYLLYKNKWLSKLTNGKYHGLYLHHILRWDGDRDLHNHPWNDFAVLILKGGYTEEVPHPAFERWWRPGKPMLERQWELFSFRQSKGTQLHRIIEEGFKPTWSLFLAGPKSRTWGFMTDKGWVPFDVWLNENCPEQMEENNDPTRHDKDSD